MNNKLIVILAIAGVFIFSGCGGSVETDNNPTITTTDNNPTITTSDTPTDTNLLEAYTAFNYDEAQQGHYFGECVLDNGNTEPMLLDTNGWVYIGYPDKDTEYIKSLRPEVDGSIIYNYSGSVTADVHELFLQSFSLAFDNNRESLSGTVEFKYYDTQDIISCQATLGKDAKTVEDLDLLR